MPFNNAQALLRKVLPESAFNGLYQRACNAYDAYIGLYDHIYYRLPRLDRGDRETMRMLRTAKPHTMTSREGLTWTLYTVRETVGYGVHGAFVECGVARGGCSALMAMVASKEGRGRNTWLFDSFEGLPPQTPEDGEQKAIRHKSHTANDLATGYCLGTWDDVYDYLFCQIGLNQYEVHLVKGWFQSSLPKHRELIGDIAVLRLDGDWYESTKCCLENLYSNVVSGGWVIIDDYQLPGCKKAVDEYLLSVNQIPLMYFDANGRAYWKK